MAESIEDARKSKLLEEQERIRRLLREQEMARKPAEELDAQLKRIDVDGRRFTVKATPLTRRVASSLSPEDADGVFMLHTMKATSDALLCAIAGSGSDGFRINPETVGEAFRGAGLSDLYPTDMNVVRRAMGVLMNESGRRFAEDWEGMLIHPRLRERLLDTAVKQSEGYHVFEVTSSGREALDEYARQIQEKIQGVEDRSTYDGERRLNPGSVYYDAHLVRSAGFVPPFLGDAIPHIRGLQPCAENVLRYTVLAAVGQGYTQIPEGGRGSVDLKSEDRVDFGRVLTHLRDRCLINVSGDDLRGYVDRLIAEGLITIAGTKPSVFRVNTKKAASMNLQEMRDRLRVESEVTESRVQTEVEIATKDSDGRLAVLYTGSSLSPENIKSLLDLGAGSHVSINRQVASLRDSELKTMFRESGVDAEVSRETLSGGIGCAVVSWDNKSREFLLLERVADGRVLDVLRDVGLVADAENNVRLSERSLNSFRNMRRHSKHAGLSEEDKARSIDAIDKALKEEHAREAAYFEVHM